MNENQAYQYLSESLLFYSDDKKWDKLVLSALIFYKMTQSSYMLFYKNEIINKNIMMPIDILGNESNSLLYLRDHMLNLTGDRIWGLTFTLYPDGKFEIEYDYNKPDDYEETDEVITGEEINQSLNDLFSPKS